ncbi:MAG TPA: PAS domain S-box protein, partial [Candidatus Kryptobacter bacterium]|nr:PAS domain S-box protein [Candidatus Kryptobacter bacterium]
MDEENRNALEILHLEDNPSDAELIHELLKDAGIKCRVEVVKSRKEYSNALKDRKFDLILSDFTLPSFSGAESLTIARGRVPETPFVFVSGTIGEDSAIQALLDGATDYVLKTKLTRLVPAVNRAIEEADKKRKLRLAEKMREMALEDLRNLERRYRGLLESAPDAVLITAGNEQITFVNKKTEELFGYEPAELIGKSVSLLVPKQFRRMHENHMRQYNSQPHKRAMGSGLELFACRKDGSEFPADIMLAPLANDNEVAVLVMIRDLTETNRAQKALMESEQRFRTVYEASPLGIVNIDKEGRFLACNPAAIELFGYSEEELLAKSFNDVTHPDDRQIGISTLSGLSSGKRSIARLEKRYIRKDSKVILASLTTSAVRDEQDQFHHAVSIIEDITERRAAEEALRDSEEQYRGLVDGVRDAIFSLSPDGIIRSLNPAFESITGWNRDEWIGRSIIELLHPDDREKAVSALRRMSDGESAGVVEYRSARQSGGYVTVELNVAPKVRDGKVVGMLGIARDVTAQKIMEEELRQSQKLEGLGTLAGGIAHDFNNILAIIGGYASFLRKIVGQDEKGARSLDSIESAADRAKSLVSQLLMFARKEERVLDYVNVNDLVNEMYGLISETFPKQIKVEVELHEGRTVVYGDQSEIHQVLLNLCVNARDAMMDREDSAISGGTLKIRTAILQGSAMKREFPSAGEHEYLMISVTDTGEGMDVETRRRIFEPFFTTKPEGKGTGLGLSTAYGIVQSHGGLLDVKSAVGNGSTFSVYLPASNVEVKSGGQSSPAEPGITGGNETILIVEDEPGLCEFLEDLLTGEGYKVLTAQDGERAISLFFNHPEVKLVLTDVGLPKIGGIELMETFRMINPDARV